MYSAMTFQDICNHFGTASAAAKYLGISRQSVQNWKTRGRIPFDQQYRIQLLTKNKLKADTASLLKNS